MKNTELRIGNYFQGTLGEIYQVELLGNGNNENYISGRGVAGFCQNDFNPIPLTEEWLLKFGLNDKKHDLGIWNNGDAIYFDFGFEKSVRIEYVHQLQNLYFALTGEELTPKEK